MWGGALSAPGKAVVVLFNKSPEAGTLTASWDLVGLRAGAALPVRDVYAKADLGAAASLSAEVQPHGVRVFVVG